MSLVRGLEACIRFRDNVGLRVSDWESTENDTKVAKEDRRSFYALDELVKRIEELELPSIYERLAGQVSLTRVTLGLDADIDDDDEPYFKVGIEGIDVASAMVIQEPAGVWKFADRWGDGIEIALEPRDGFGSMEDEK